jgi:hypothetical protein
MTFAVQSYKSTDKNIHCGTLAVFLFRSDCMFPEHRQIRRGKMPADLVRKEIHQNLIIPFLQLLLVRLYIVENKKKKGKKTERFRATNRTDRGPKKSNPPPVEQCFYPTRIVQK